MDVRYRSRLRRILSVCAVSAVPATLSLLVHAQTPAPDTSAANRGQQSTGEQQPGHYSDRELTAKIHQSLMRDQALSAYGHSLAITCQDGMVTLKGIVHSEDEKQAIAEHAAAFAGPDKVTNNLVVQP